MSEKSKTVAYLSMEYALEENFPIYAGGLGVLAADLTFSAGEKNLNFHSFGIFYYRGFHAHKKDEEADLNPETAGFQKLLDPLKKAILISVPLENHEVWVQVWTKSYGGSQIALFDTNIEQNNEEDRKITQYLYDPDRTVMFKQQIILGFGTVKLTKILKINPDVYHLNEGHTSIILLALAIEHHKSHPNDSLNNVLEQIKQLAVGTKHTILTGGGLHLTIDQIKTCLAQTLEKENWNFEDFFGLGTHESHPDKFSTTRFMLRFTKAASAVSVAHALAEKKVHSHSDLVPITNGVNKNRWQSHNLQNLKSTTDLDFWNLHLQNKIAMLDYLRSQTPHKLDPNVLTIVWARRFASYKRPELLFANVEHLSRLTQLFPAAQFIIAGQTNPADADAQELATEIQNEIQKFRFSGRIVFLTSYSLSLALKLVAGADVWLNTPLPGFEASGTSGMKAGINGALEFSTLDGWIEEINLPEIGWTLPEENIHDELYSILEKKIIPLYYQIDGGKYPPGWVEKMRKTIELIDQKYTTKRVLEDYYNKLYFPAIEQTK